MSDSQHGYTVTVHIVRDDGFDGDGPVTHHYRANDALHALQKMVDETILVDEAIRRSA